MITDWDLFWRFERLHRRFEPVDFRRWKRASQRALREMFPGSVCVLDSTAGLGDHSVNLAELGFDVEACDPSEQAREATREALDAAGFAAVPIHDARWDALGLQCRERFDLIFNDAIHWLETEDEMHQALSGLRDALRPGGALVFFFADPSKPERGEGMSVLAWDREHLKPHRLCWEHPYRDGTATLVVVSHDAQSHIDEHHLYLVRNATGTTLSSTILRRIYRWDWQAMNGALSRAGYGRVVGHHFTNDKGQPFAMCLAYR